MLNKAPVKAGAFCAIATFRKSMSPLQIAAFALTPTTIAIALKSKELLHPISRKFSLPIWINFR
jgi:hypothetical protein